MSLNNNNDPFEEFEFKPLTEGLGFHRKKSESNSGSFEMKATPISAPLKRESQISSTPSMNQPAGLKSPLPRMPQHEEIKPIITPKINVPIIEDDSIAKAQTAVNEILKNLNHKKQQEENLLKNKKKMIWASSAPSLMASFLDSMLVLAGFLLMLIAMLTITGADLITNITNPGENKVIWLATALLLLSVHVIYMVLFRAYMGYTPGEWAFDQRCGNETQQASAMYVPKVLARTLIVALTGFIPLSIAAALFRIDIAGIISGLQIQKQKYV